MSSMVEYTFTIIFAWLWTHRVIPEYTNYIVKRLEWHWVVQRNRPTAATTRRARFTQLPHEVYVNSESAAHAENPNYKQLPLLRQPGRTRPEVRCFRTLTRARATPSVCWQTWNEAKLSDTAVVETRMIFRFEPVLTGVLEFERNSVRTGPQSRINNSRYKIRDNNSRNRNGNVHIMFICCLI